MNTDTPSKDVAKTYVWHGDKCFFVSTIERDSSSAINPCRFNETIVWEYDWDKRERGAMLHVDEGPRHSLSTHNRVVEAFYAAGRMPYQE